MRLKNEIEYVFRILLYLTINGENRIISSNEISEKEEIPHLFSLRILKKLEKADLVIIFKGAKGGYKLKKDSSEITLKDAIESIEGDICIKDCLESPESCTLRKGNCGVHRVLKDIESQFISRLQDVNFRDLADGKY
ncbi:MULTISPECIES: Rrf2 family transcriptional regulator [Fusobacterium]|uniref:RrF2 family transcriptional regulator n=1 Tax=Fusobacterium TaxID=848 RepID=UPI001032A58E|nr:Rrf2 family transcriptional regulator [Fusobacterium ulcerans]